MPVELPKFNLTTPEADASGDAVTHYPPFSNNTYFELQADGKVTLWAPTKGATTENSSRTRTEFREIDEVTQEQRNFVFAEENVTLRVGVTMTQVTPNGRVVIAQFHLKASSKPLLKVEFDNGKLKAKIRQHLNGSEVVVRLHEGVRM
ncbi:MAG: polysaccharide lyase family 7 protein [Gammaproteobacteria bacterium]